MAQHRKNDILVPFIGVAFDAIAIEVSFLFSYWLRFKTSVLSFLGLHEGTPPLPAYIYGSCFAVIVWLILFQSKGMYGARRNSSLGNEFFSVVGAVTLGMLVVMSAAFFYRAFSYSRVVFFLLWISSIVFIMIGRGIVLSVERLLYARGRELRNALIIGTNEMAKRIYERFRDHRLSGYRLVGYVGDLPCAGQSGLADSEYLGGMNNVPGILSEKSVELAFIALENHQAETLASLMEDCEGMQCEFLLMPDILQITWGGLRVKELDGLPFIRVKSMPMTPWGRILKRVFDLFLSTILLILFSPLFLLIVVVTKLDSKGTIFYKQKRVGIDGKEFMMLKFRSMRTGAEEESGPVWAADRDPRRTRFGAFLRGTSIDELPQLVNVLKGEMSLVGPRPERPFFVEQFKDHVPKYLERHRMKTGMTGWAQVNGLRGNTSLADRIKYDLFYIENWTLLFDIKILFLTFRALVSSKPVKESF